MADRPEAPKLARQEIITSGEQAGEIVRAGSVAGFRCNEGETGLSRPQPNWRVHSRGFGGEKSYSGHLSLTYQLPKGDQNGATLNDTYF